MNCAFLSIFGILAFPLYAAKSIKKSDRGVLPAFCKFGCGVLAFFDDFFYFCRRPRVFRFQTFRKS